MSEEFEPVGGDFATTRTVQLGYEYDEIEKDGKTYIVYRRDERGNRIPKTYEIPAFITPYQIFRAATADQSEQVQKELAAGGLTTYFALLGIAIGREKVIEMASDPTVTYVEFENFVLKTMADLGLIEKVSMDPTGGPSGPQ